MSPSNELFWEGYTVLIFRKNNVILRAETERKAKELIERGFTEIKEEDLKKGKKQKTVKKEEAKKDAKK